MNDNPNKCQSCGTIYPYEVRYHSGSRECQSCWDWRKLIGPASLYWTEAIENLFHNENGAGPDLIDLQTWKKWGIQDEVIEALNTLEALRVRYEILRNVDIQQRAEILREN